MRGCGGLLLVMLVGLAGCADPCGPAPRIGMTLDELRKCRPYASINLVNPRNGREWWDLGRWWGDYRSVIVLDGVVRGRGREGLGYVD